MSSPRAVVGMYSFVSPDPVRLAGFWGALMQLPSVEVSPDLVMLDLEHTITPQTWLFQRGDSTQPGDQLGLDIHIEDDADWASLADTAESLGARRVAEHAENGVQWIDMRDPDANRFRVFAPRPV